jgi:hypothetical protein
MSLAEMLARQLEILNSMRRENRDMTEDERTEFENLTRTIQAQSQSNDNQNGEGTPAPQDEGTPSEPATEDQRAEGATAERERITEIYGMCRDLGIDDSTMLRYINSGNSLDSVRSQIITLQRESGAPLGQGNGAVEVTDSGEDKFRRAAVDGLLMRGGISLNKPADGASDFRGMSMKDLAVEILTRENEGKNLLRKSPDEIFTMLGRSFYNPSAAFPSIMDQVVNKAYVEGHKTANVTFDKFVKKGSLSDFKKHDNFYLSGPVGEFLEVPENGELKADKISDKKKPQRQLKTYGRQFTMTRQAFINDDIGLFTRVPAKYAQSARKTQNKQVYEILMNNPKIYDNKALFHADHGNLVTTGTGITAESLKKMILALSTQKDDFGEAIVIRPAKIVVPVGYAFDMYTLFFSPTINTSGNTQAVNPLYAYKESIEIIEDPTINALAGGSGNVMPWWLLADSNDTDFIEIDYLNGQEIPTIRRSEVPGTLGFIWDVYLDWGISVMDYRGAIKNPGIQVTTDL